MLICLQCFRSKKEKKIFKLVAVLFNQAIYCHVAGGTGVVFILLQV